jgi:hypothetical protein
MDSGFHSYEQIKSAMQARMGAGALVTPDRKRKREWVMQAYIASLFASK